MPTIALKPLEEGSDARTSDDEARQLELELGHAFDIGEPLGRGGVGVVYAARDLLLDRPVALKILRADLAITPTVIRRLEREARTVARLRHPHILPIYSIGEMAGAIYMVMPLIQGGSLADHLERQGQLSQAEALRIGRELALALGEAHASGIVHRDVKPQNVMLEGPERHTLLMDFGLAKLMAGEGEALTMTGVTMGTPRYMSPEQVAGDKDIDHRSDIYSLGCVLYEMLAGDPPFVGTNVRTIMTRHLVDPPPSLEVARPGLPKDLYEIVGRGLAKVPGDRFQSAGELARALSHVEKGGGGSWIVDGLRTPELRRSRRMSLAALSLVLGLGIGIPAYLSLDGRGVEMDLMGPAVKQGVTPIVGERSVADRPAARADPTEADSSGAMLGDSVSGDVPGKASTPAFSQPAAGLPAGEGPSPPVRVVRLGAPQFRIGLQPSAPDWARDAVRDFLAAHSSSAEVVGDDRADIVVRRSTAGSEVDVLGADGTVIEGAISQSRLEVLRRHVERLFLIGRLSALSNPAQPFEVRVGVLGPTGGVEVFTGDRVVITVESGRAGYVTLVAVEPSGELSLLIPNAFQRSVELEAGRQLRFPPTDAPFEFVATPPSGTGFVAALVTDRWLDLERSDPSLPVFRRIRDALIEAHGSGAGGEEVLAAGWSTGFASYRVRPPG